MLNKATLIGNLGRDPEVKRMQDGKPIVTLSVATTETWKDKQTGDRREKTEWHRVVIFNEGLAGVAEKYLKKGSKLYLEGKLVTRKWTDQKGEDKYTTEIVLNNFDGRLLLLTPKGEQPSAPAPAADVGESFASKPPLRNELNDEIPF
jgi:single-strand DNA-binding protein